MFGSNTQPVGSIFQVNTNITADQEFSAVALDTSSNFTITWSGHQNGHWNIYAQSYLASGAANGGNFQVNATTGQDQEYSEHRLCRQRQPHHHLVQSKSGRCRLGRF